MQAQLGRRLLVFRLAACEGRVSNRNGRSFWSAQSNNLGVELHGERLNDAGPKPRFRLGKDAIRFSKPVIDDGKFPVRTRVMFEDAIFKAAQIAYDANFNGKVLVFSWPAAGRFYKYNYDRDSAQFSVGDLLTILRILTEESEIGEKLKAGRALTDYELHCVIHVQLPQIRLRA
jgi:hypothetical protein